MRFNCKAVIAYHEIHGKINCISIGKAAKKTGLTQQTVRKLLENGRHSMTGWKFIYDETQDSPVKPQKKSESLSDENPSPLWLSLEEIENLYQLLKKDVQEAALCKPYSPDYRWPLYDKVAELRGNCNNSHDEYEYWRDWNEKNREDWK